MRSLNHWMSSLEEPWQRVLVLAGTFLLVALTVGLVAWEIASPGRNDDGSRVAGGGVSFPAASASTPPTLTPTPAPPASTRPAPAKNHPVAAAVPTTTAATHPPRTGGPTAKPTTKAARPKASTPVTKAAGTEPVVSAPILIHNLGTGLCVDLPNFGPEPVTSLVAQYTCTAGEDDNQDFELLEVGDEFLIRNVKSHLCIDIGWAGALDPGADIGTYTCIAGTADNQMYRREPSGGGVKLVNLKSDLCLDVSSVDGAVDQPGRKLTMATCGAAPTQVWKLG